MARTDDQKRNDALACRVKAMTTWAKAEASGEASHSGKESATGEDCKEKRKKKKSKL